MKYFTVKEAAKTLDLPTRTIQYYCKKFDVWKRSNRYQITEENINDWRKIPRKSAQLRVNPAQLRNNSTQLHKEKVELEEVVKNLLNQNQKLNEQFDKHLAKPKDEELNKTIKNLYKQNQELKEQLKQYEISDNERIEVFTLEDYELFKERLIQWQEQRRELEHKDQIFEERLKSKDVVIATAEELQEHYKNQYYYQRQLASKQLQQIEKLIDNLGKYIQKETDQNYLEAYNKGIVKKRIIIEDEDQEDQ